MINSVIHILNDNTKMKSKKNNSQRETLVDLHWEFNAANSFRKNWEGK